jgi:hypothetical protein
MLSVPQYCRRNWELMPLNPVDASGPWTINFGVSNTKKKLLYYVLIACVQSKLRSVQSSRWDKSHSPIEAPDNYLSD